MGYISNLNKAQRSQLYPLIMNVKNSQYASLSTFPPFRKRLHFGERASLKALDPIPNFSFRFRYPFPILWEGILHSQSEIVNGVRLIGIPLFIRRHFLCIGTSQKPFRPTPAPSLSLPFFESKIPTFGS